MHFMGRAVHRNQRLGGAGAAEEGAHLRATRQGQRTGQCSAISISRARWVSSSALRAMSMQECIAGVEVGAAVPDRHAHAVSGQALRAVASRMVAASGRRPAPRLSRL